MTETRQIYVRAVEDRRVLKPGTRDAVTAQGELVDFSPFWLRRLQDGDVVEGELSATPADNAGKPSSKSAAAKPPRSTP